MQRTNANPKESSFNFRVDTELKQAFAAAASAEHKPSGQLLRDFMRAYVERQRMHAVTAEARRQSRLIAKRAADPAGDEAEVMRWIDDVTDAESWTA